MEPPAARTLTNVKLEIVAARGEATAAFQTLRTGAADQREADAARVADAKA